MKLWLVAALALVVSSAAIPTAFAEDEHHDDHHDRDRHHVVVRRDRHDDRDWHSRPYIAPVPGYSYTPPVVYAPEPEPPGINIILPLNIH